MNPISLHITRLLTENDCVILPGIGGFITRYKKAVYDASAEEILSPKRELGFNSALTADDGLLVQAYMDSYGLNWPEASKRLASDTEALLGEITSGGQAELEGLGTLRRTDSGTFAFQPSCSETPAPSLYGLPSVNARAIATAAAETEPENDGTANDREMYHLSLRRSWVYKIAATVAAIALAFAIPSPIANEPQNANLQATAMLGILDDFHAPAAPESATENTAESQSADTAAASAPRAEKAESAPQTVTEKPYTIVLASSVAEANAREFISSLKAQGFADAEIHCKPGMRRVIYSHYATEDEARAELGKLRENDFARDAWIMKIHD